MTGQEILQKNARFAENLRRQAEKIDLGQLEELAKASYENSGDIVGMVEQMVTTFHPAGKQPEKILAGPYPAADSALDEVAAAKEMA